MAAFYVPSPGVPRHAFPWTATARSRYEGVRETARVVSPRTARTNLVNVRLGVSIAQQSVAGG